MTEDQAHRVVALGKRGFSVNMIYRAIYRESSHRIDPRSIAKVLRNVGLDDRRDDRQEPIEMQRYSAPGELRARWAALIEPMKAKLRASIGGV